MRESWTSFVSLRDKSITLHLPLILTLRALAKSQNWSTRPVSLRMKYWSFLKIFIEIPQSRAYRSGINLTVIWPRDIPQFSTVRVPNRHFPYLNLEIRDFSAKSGRDSELKVYSGGEMPIVTLGITGLHEILGRDYEI